jgi:hypothetical protein
MDKVFTWVWTVAGLVLSALVVGGVLALCGAWWAGIDGRDEDLAYHGGVSLVFLAAYLPWFVPHYWLRPTLTGLLVPFAGVAAAPYLFLLLLLFTMETPGVTVHVRTVVMVTAALAPVAGTVWFVARCRRRWARLGVRADETPGGRLAEVVEVARHAQWTGVRLVDVRSGEREQAWLRGRFRVGEVCVVDDALWVLERAAPIVRGFGRNRTVRTSVACRSRSD